MLMWELSSNRGKWWVWGRWWEVVIDKIAIFKK